MKKFKTHEAIALHFDFMKSICIYAKEHDYDPYEIYKDIIDAGHDCPEESKEFIKMIYTDLENAESLKTVSYALDMIFDALRGDKNDAV